MSVWDKLSVEIYDEIFSHIPEPITDCGRSSGRYWRPSRHADELDKFDFICAAGQPNYGYYFRDGETKLRLVCKAFDRAMTRAFFKHHPALFRVYREKDFQRLQEFIIDEQAVVAPQVTRLEFELSPGRWRNSLFEKKSEGGDTQGSQDSHDSAANVYKLFPKLEEVISKLPKLERLVVNIHEICRSEGPVDIDSEDEEEKEETGPKLDLDLLAHIRDTLSHILSSSRIELRMLTHLRLRLFSVYDLAIIGAQIPDEIANQLRQLYLEFTDGTGPGGDLQYTHHWQGDEDSDGDENMPHSNLQKRFPNTDYMANLCGFISRCHNLKSLGLAGTQCIDLAALDWKPADTGLEGLYLNRAVGTSAQLISLLSPNIMTVDIQDMQLFDNTWGNVFDHLATCPSLTYIHVYNLVYAKLGESAEHRRWNNRPWENVSVIWSEHEEDERSLRRLVKRVEGRGGSSGVDIDDLEGGEEDDEDVEELEGVATV